MTPFDNIFSTKDKLPTDDWTEFDQTTKLQHNRLILKSQDCANELASVSINYAGNATIISCSCYTPGKPFENVV